MRRISLLLMVVGLAVASGAPAMTSASHARLERYLTKVDARIHSYRGLLEREEALLTSDPHVNVDPLVEQLYRLADRFEDLDARWQAVAGPKGLKVRHRGMGQVFVLFAEALRIRAAALFTRHPDEILAARPKVEARLRSAAYLQKRWAAALRGALIRADLEVPRWLRQMASLRVP